MCKQLNWKCKERTIERNEQTKIKITGIYIAFVRGCNSNAF